MSYDQGPAALLRDDLEGRPGLSEQGMFGGLAFMLFSNTLCGVTAQGAMFRVGKTR